MLAMKDATPQDARLKARRLFYEHLDVADRILRDARSSKNLKLRALDLLGKYGVGAATVQLDGQGNPMQLPPISIMTTVAATGDVQVQQIAVTDAREK